jgi:hypothetical protein
MKIPAHPFAYLADLGEPVCKALIPLVQQGLITLHAEPDFTPAEVSADFLPDFTAQERPSMNRLISMSIRKDTSVIGSTTRFTLLPHVFSAISAINPSLADEAQALAGAGNIVGAYRLLTHRLAASGTAANGPKLLQQTLFQQAEDPVASGPSATPPRGPLHAAAGGLTPTVASDAPKAPRARHRFVGLSLVRSVSPAIRFPACPLPLVVYRYVAIVGVRVPL